MKLKEIRTEKGLSQKELAEQSSVPFRTVQDIEQMKTDPRLSNVLKISKALGVTLDQLCASTEEN